MTPVNPVPGTGERSSARGEDGPDDENEEKLGQNDLLIVKSAQRLTFSRGGRIAQDDGRVGSVPFGPGSA